MIEQMFDLFRRKSFAMQIKLIDLSGNGNQVMDLAFAARTAFKPAINGPGAAHTNVGRDHGYYRNVPLKYLVSLSSTLTT